MEFIDKYVNDEADQEDLEFVQSMHDDMMKELHRNLIILLSLEFPHRSPSIFRERWNSEYLTNLAIAEGSFVAAY